MRFFYVKAVKKYILVPAVITFLLTLLLQFNQNIFLKELEVLSLIKNRLGYSSVFFAQNTFLSIRLLLSIFYAFFAGTLGLFYFRLHNYRAGHTILLSNTFQGLVGIGYIVLIYAILHTEGLIINPINLPVPSAPQVATGGWTDKLKALFTPNFNLSIKGPFPNAYNYPKSTNNTQNTNSYSNSRGTGSTSNGQTQTQNQPVKPQTQTQNPQPQVVRMATASELHAVLNVHRQRNGRGTLQWDAQLGNYAQQRANLFNSIGNTDHHAGFTKDTNNGINYTFKFYGLGENSSYGVRGDAKYIIEQWYGTSPAHNNSQLDSRWTHVGIGVNGSATDFIFGGGKTDSFHVD